MIIRDFTERKRAEEELRESEQWFVKAFQANPVAMALVTLDDARFIDVNETFQRVYGYSREEAVGHTAFELGIWVDPSQRTEFVRAHREEGTAPDRVVQMRTKAGNVREMLWGGTLFAVGGKTLLLGAAIDITERKRAEAERAAAMSRLAMVQEEERRRLARELHDQTAQRLVALAVELKTLETNLAAGRPQGDRVRSLRKTVDDLQQHVRRLAWDLRAGELVEGDLERALREYVEDWSDRVGVPVDCECRGLGGKRLPAPVAATLYRVAREALANVEKHARARRVSVLLERDKTVARLTVEDDGRGFDEDAVREAPEAAPRLGLLGMKERVALVGGKLLIESSPGSGTTVLARVPIPAEGKPS
jgi:PAS domain S-box-containing protein